MRNRRLQLYLALVGAFLIGNYKGYIALWTEENTHPVYISPYSVASLPPADQQRVNEGIRVTDEGQLRQLLEDYLS